MPPAAEDYWIALEGGGSRTWLACMTVAGVHAAQAGPTGTRSVAEEQSLGTLAALASKACRAAGADPGRCRAVVAAHGAASTRASCAAFHGLLKKALSRAGVRSPVLVTNDLVPLLLGGGGDPPPLVVVVAGTGTGFGARSAAGAWARASGCEYLLSDEGGGFDIGLAGLRAAIRAGDGRSPATTLRQTAAQWCGGRPATLAEDLSEKVYVPGHKPLIASFARHVLDAAPHDPAAAAIVACAARELAAGATAVARAAGCPPGSTRILLAGSLLTRHDALAGALRAELDDQPATVVLPDGWLLSGLRQLHQAWICGDSAITQAVRAFPVTGDGT
jgi:N-acetylglucosamine kinase-like BadF-type ATPase